MRGTGSMSFAPSRREILAAFLYACATPASGSLFEPPSLQLTTFTADLTPQLGHPCIGGGIASVPKIDEPLFAHGSILLGYGKPIVICGIDWCEIRNDAYERWCSVLADAAGTETERVLVACLHQHDAPVADLEAERILKKNGA